MSELTNLNEEKDKHHVVITEKLFRYITSKGSYNETFDQILERLLQNQTKQDILRLASEEY